MSGYNFGKSFTYEFHVIDAESNEVDISQATLDKVYLFDELPSRTDAAAGTGASETISTWTTKDKHKELTIPEIEDPEVTGAFKVYDNYWLAVNFTFSGGTQKQTELMNLTFERIKSQASETGVTYEDITKAFPLIDRYFSNTNDITNLIEVAEEQIKITMSTKGFAWAQIKYPKGLHTAVKYKTLKDICLVQIADAGDKWEMKYNEYSGYYENIITSTKIEYDSSNDSAVDTVERKQRVLRIIR